MNPKIQKIIDRVKKAQTKVQKLVKDKTWVNQAKKYAERQGKDVKKVIDSDVAKVRAFLDREKKELEKLKTSIPGEVDKIRSFVDSQKSDLQTLLATVKKEAEAKAKQAKDKLRDVRSKSGGSKTTSKKTAGAKKTTAKKVASKTASKAPVKTTAKTTAKKTAKKSAQA